MHREEKVKSRLLAEKSEEIASFEKLVRARMTFRLRDFRGTRRVCARVCDFEWSEYGNEKKRKNRRKNDVDTYCACVQMKQRVLNICVCRRADCA